MRMRKRGITLVSVIIVIVLLAPLTTLAAKVGDTEISSGAAAVIDFDTGTMLYGYNENVQRVPASTLKILAAYVVYDAVKAGELSLDTKVLISKGTSEFSNNKVYSNVPLPEGASYTLRQLMDVVMVRSACAATVAMGEALCGSEKAFVARMKEKATQLGVEAKIYDCWGGSPDNRISALGMAVLTRGFIMDHPDILTVTSKRTITFDENTYGTSNLLLDKYTGLDGFKTGFTNPAGYCFIGTAKQGGRRIISVTMGSTLELRYPDTSALLDYGFSITNKAAADYANPSSANLILDKETRPLNAYIINDYHYFKLRDIAYLLNGTTKQFQVMWSRTDNTVNLTGGVPYTADGSELKLPFSGLRRFEPTPSMIFFNGAQHQFEAYLIDGYNYFRLRDLGDLIGFTVDWEDKTQTVIVDTAPINMEAA